MKRRGYWIFWCAMGAAFPVLSDSGPQPIAEVKVSERLVSQLAFEGHQTTPFSFEGRPVTPDITVTVTPRLRDAQGQVAASLDVSVEGTSHSHTRTYRRRGKRHIDTFVDTDVSALYEKEFSLSETGLVQGDLYRHYSHMDPSVSSSSNHKRRWARNLATGIANGIALDTATSIQPRAKARLDGQMGTGIGAAMSQGGSLVDQVLAQAHSLFTQHRELPFEGQLSSRASRGDNPGGITLSLVESTPGGERKAPPKLERSQQAVLQTQFHQDMLAQSIAPEIAGKELKLYQLKAHLCGPKTERLLDFCQQELPADARDLAILFDEKKPIEFVFDKGKITIRMNAIYRKITVPEGTTPPEGALLDSPSKDGVTFESIPYTAEFVYKLTPGGAELEGLRVKNRDQGNPLIAALASGLGLHDDGGEGRSLSGAALAPVVAKKLEDGFRKAVKEKIQFPTLSVPTRIRAERLGDSNAPPPQMVGAGSLIPLEAKSENGWMALSSTLCTDEMKPLGASFETVRVQRGGFLQSWMRVTSVTPGAPAEMMGLEPGQWIESYGLPGENQTRVAPPEQGFYDFIAERARFPSSDEREVEFVVVNAQQKREVKKVALCPSGLNHRANAQTFVGQARALAQP